MERIGFFGGCFNPITNAHINLIKEVIEKENLSKVYFVPMGDLYDKEDLISLKNRIEMLKIAFEGEQKLDILDISNKTEKTYAIDTFRKIDEKFAGYQRFFIMGSDNYKKLGEWKSHQELIHNYKYIILDREGGEMKDISSSMIRNKIKANENIYDLIPKDVVKYIEQKNLYK